MRVSREQVEENRQTILEQAGRLFRARGFEAVTVAEIMQAAGLTHGGFYGYFRSKEDLIAASLGEALSNAKGPASDLATFADRYLSRSHRDDVARGCTTAALAAETRRQPGEARTAMTAALERQIERLSQISPGETPPHKRQAAIGTWSAMVGAMILARVCEDQALSDEVLDQTRAWLLGQSAPADQRRNRRKAGKREETANG